ncbi:MAG: YkgJ family cysteine cluster protein [Anaerolineales bacterium]
MTLPYLVTDLETLRHAAQARADDYDAFRYYVEDDVHTDAQFDALVEALAAPIIGAIDCTECAHCCRSLAVYVTPQDVQHLAAGLGQDVQTIRATYIDHERAQAVEEWGMLKAAPCPFLQDKLCGVYPQRPESCRAYPEFTPDFRWQLGHILGGVGRCPIIYNVIEAVQIHLKWKSASALDTGAG